MTTLQVTIVDDEKSTLDKAIQVMQTIKGADITTLKIIQELPIPANKENIQKPKKGKWADFAERMSGLTNSNITKQIKETHTDMKETFQFRDLKLSK